MRTRTLAAAAALALFLPTFATARGNAERGSTLEIFSWWTAGGEAEGLAALFDLYHSQFPSINIINATVAGRRLERQVGPPDAHAGREPA